MTRYPGQVAGYRATDKAGLPDARLTRDQNHTGSCVVQAVTDEVDLPGCRPIPITRPLEPLPKRYHHRVMISSRDGTTVAPAAAPVPDFPVARPTSLRRRRSPWGELWRWGVTLVGFFVAALVVAGLVLVVAIYRQARTDQARPAGAIVVLGTAQYNGWPGPVF